MDLPERAVRILQKPWNSYWCISSRMYIYFFNNNITVIKLLTERIDLQVSFWNEK